MAVCIFDEISEKVLNFQWANSMIQEMDSYENTICTAATVSVVQYYDMLILSGECCYEENIAVCA